ncbi:hypothetical protein L3Q82_021043, partial [Scortum barcoo]
CQMDARLGPLRSFALRSLSLEPETWSRFVSEEDNQVTFNSFFSTPEYRNLFLCRRPEAGLSVSIDFPKHGQSKVICVCRTGREGITKENVRQTLNIQEVQGEDVMDFIISVAQQVTSPVCRFSAQVTCPLLSNPETSSTWAVGVAEEALRFMERLKNETQVMKAQMEGRTFLPHPDAVHDGGLHDNAVHDGGLHDNAVNDGGLHDNAVHDGGVHDGGLHDNAVHDGGLHDNAVHDGGVHDDAEGRKLSDVKLLHACDSTIIEWAELVSDFLQQDSSQPVLDGQKPLPSEEFNFWKSRLKNLRSIQQQCLNLDSVFTGSATRAQQVASIVQLAESVYWSTLRNIYADVQKGLKEAEDVTLNLKHLQEKLEEVEQMEYQQLGDNMAAVMDEVRLVWIRSEFYCKPCRMVVLLQEICNLFIQKSRRFLRGEEVMRGLVSGPGPVLADVRLVIWTLQTLRDAYSRCRVQLEHQDQKQDRLTLSWDFPAHLIFFHLDNFLTRLQSIQAHTHTHTHTHTPALLHMIRLPEVDVLITSCRCHLHLPSPLQEVLCVSMQLYQLDQTVLSGVSGRMWTDVLQDVYQDFLSHVTVLSDCNCDPTDPDDQSFELHMDQFQVQVADLERRLVSVLSRAFEDCCVSSSAAKLVKMFGFVLDRPLIQDQLRPHLVRLVALVSVELDQTELLFHSQREKSETFSRFTPPAAAGLCWTQELRLRAEDALNNFKTVQHLCINSGESQLVMRKLEQIVDLLQDFRGRVKSEWSCQLDSDCDFILDQPLIQQRPQGLLGVNCSHKVEEVLRGLRYVSRETDVELRPHSAQLFTCRGNITQSYLRLSQMVSCYNQVVSDIMQVELPLIQDQLQDLNQTLSELQRNKWSCEGVLQLVEQQREKVLIFHSTVSEARANMDAMTHIIQGWAELHLLQRSGDSLLEGGAAEQSYRRIREEGQQLLRLTQVNRSLYGAEDSSESWIRYLDHIDDKVQDGLFQLLFRSLRLLSDNTNPQSCSAALFAVHLQLQETGSVFEPSVGGGLSDILTTIIVDIYTAASLPPRISASHHGNYQVTLSSLRHHYDVTHSALSRLLSEPVRTRLSTCPQVSLQQHPDLSALEQEVMRHLLQVREEAERLRAGLDRYSYLWQSDRTEVMQEFLTYSRQLKPEELEAEETPPTLKDFQREIESLHRIRTEVTHLDDVIILHGWLQVDLRPFRDTLLSLIHDWTHMYTEYLLDLASDSLQQATQRGDGDEDSSSSSSFPLTETIILLETAGVQLPEHLSAQLQVVTSDHYPPDRPESKGGTMMRNLQKNMSSKKNKVLVNTQRLHGNTNKNINHQRPFHSAG